jgi:hypothetical protein
LFRSQPLASNPAQLRDVSREIVCKFFRVHRAAVFPRKVSQAPCDKGDLIDDIHVVHLPIPFLVWHEDLEPICRAVNSAGKKPALYGRPNFGGVGLVRKSAS